MPGLALGTQQAASERPQGPGSVTLLVLIASCSICTISTWIDATPALGHVQSGEADHALQRRGFGLAPSDQVNQ